MQRPRRCSRNNGVLRRSCRPRPSTPPPPGPLLSGGLINIDSSQYLYNSTSDKCARSIHIKVLQYKHIIIYIHENSLHQLSSNWDVCLGLVALGIPCSGWTRPWSGDLSASFTTVMLIPSAVVPESPPFAPFATGLGCAAAFITGEGPDESELPLLPVCIVFRDVPTVPKEPGEAIDGA